MRGLDKETINKLLGCLSTATDGSLGINYKTDARASAADKDILRTIAATQDINAVISHLIYEDSTTGELYIKLNLLS